MKFGPCPVGEAAGAILAHSLNAGGLKFRKGRHLSAEDVASLQAAGVKRVTVARLEPGDVGEDDAAERLAARLGGPGLRVSAPFTGRANVHAETAGVLEVDAEAVARLNGIDEGITLATVPRHSRVAARQLLGTVKIIPYAVPGEKLAEAEACLAASPFRLHPFRLREARLILTETPGMKRSLLEKAEGAVAARLSALGVGLTEVVTVPHETGAVETALAAGRAELTLLFSGSATSDREDVCPAALVAAGGRIDRFGMPVDPGNLLFLGTLDGAPVVGLPGCARSPALNGADWVLERIVAGLAVTSEDISEMGVGGLLKEIPIRPQPRGVAAEPLAPRVEVILLAAGASRRMRGKDKLLEEIGGEPLLRRSAKAMIGSKADAVRVVLPPDHVSRRAALDGLDVDVVIAGEAATGMAASLKAGLAATEPGTDAALVALADMPDVTAAHVDRLIAAFDPGEGRLIARALTGAGKPGHPVLFGRRFFESLSDLTGDEGARSVIRAAQDFVVDVPTPGEGALTDLDTPEAWDAWRAAAEA